MAPILEIKQLNHLYSAGTPFEHQALTDVSFKVDRGEFIGIIGHTGSGKSTLIQHLNALLKPTSGQILLDGRIFGRIRTLPGRPASGSVWFSSIPNISCLKKPSIGILRLAQRIWGWMKKK